MKQTLLVGFREELSSFDEFEFDESYPLYAQTQQFIYETAIRDACREKKKEEDFPTLGAPANAPRARNIIDRISQEEKRRAAEETPLFAPRRNAPAFQRTNEASIFNVDNKLRSERDLMSLHKEFANMPIRDLKFVYMTFAGDYNHSREFLIVPPRPRRSTTPPPATPARSPPPPPALPPPPSCAPTAASGKKRWTESCSI